MLKHLKFSGVFVDENMSVHVTLENPLEHGLDTTVMPFGITVRVMDDGEIVPRIEDFTFYIVDEANRFYNTQRITDSATTDSTDSVNTTGSPVTSSTPITSITPDALNIADIPTNLTNQITPDTADSSVTPVPQISKYTVHDKQRPRSYGLICTHFQHDFLYQDLRMAFYYHPHQKVYFIELLH